MTKLLSNTILFGMVCFASSMNASQSAFVELLQNKLTEKDEKIAALTQINISLESSRDGLARELNKLRRKIEENDICDGGIEQLHEIQKENNQLKEKNYRLVCEIEELQKLLDETRAQLEALETNESNKVATLESDNALLKIELDDMAQQIASLKYENYTLKDKE